MSQVERTSAMAERTAGLWPSESTVHHRTTRQRRGRARGRMGLNLSAMIDVIFQLLIYFVVTANFSPDEGVLTMKLPRGAGPTQARTLAPPTQPLNIVLRSHGPVGVSIMVEHQSVKSSFAGLARRLEGLQFNKTNPDGVYRADNPVVIKPRGRVRWQHVADALNAAVTAGYSNVRFGRTASGES